MPVQFALPTTGGCPKCLARLMESVSGRLLGMFRHTYEPVSFDLVESTSIVDKANQWLGRITILSTSPERFKPYFLLGEPREQRLRSSFVKAQNILHKMPCEHEFVREADAEEFAKHLKAEINQYVK
jgi:hypothetical protein